MTCPGGTRIWVSEFSPSPRPCVPVSHPVWQLEADPRWGDAAGGAGQCPEAHVQGCLCPVAVPLSSSLACATPWPQWGEGTQPALERGAQVCGFCTEMTNRMPPRVSSAPTWLAWPGGNGAGDLEPAPGKWTLAQDVPCRWMGWQWGATGVQAHLPS